MAMKRPWLAILPFCLCRNTSQTQPYPGVAAAMTSVFVATIATGACNGGGDVVSTPRNQTRLWDLRPGKLRGTLVPSGVRSADLPQNRPGADSPRLVSASKAE